MMEKLCRRLSQTASIEEKIAVLDALPTVLQFREKFPFLHSFFSSLSQEREVAWKQMIAIGQAERLFAGVEAFHLEGKLLHDLGEKLVAIDHFYREMGGIVGYQCKVMQLLSPPSRGIGDAKYHPPTFFSIEKETEAVREAVSWGLEALEQVGEIYPLGGAADRLHLVDEKTGQELPAAKLPFAGRCLLEHLIRDVAAREELYFQRFGKRLITPIAIMTSQEKNNHAHVVQICEEAQWFGRPKESFAFFTQPLVPAVNEKGDWCVAGPLKLVLKPGGHGALWKLARDEGIFSWFAKQGRTHVLVRQINNPIAGLDYGLLAFIGIGCKKKMVFGFASCPRLLQAAEGVNVLIEKGKHIVLTNVEYCDFDKFGIEDRPLKEGEPYSKFSSNTNILFADLQAISQAVDACPFPGLLMNLKKGSYVTATGEKREETMARLESTMQNIADVFVEEKKESLQTERTFVTYSARHKTISTAKKAYLPGKALQETPENCFYDLLCAHRELLLECGFQLPAPRTLADHLQKGPEMLFLYHPALGPLYSHIRQKMEGGSLALGAELVLEIGDLKARELHVAGSLQIIADGAVGMRQGKCILENVTVENRGVIWEKSAPFWRMKLARQETVKVILRGQSQFIARNVQLTGSQTFIVEDGQTLEI